MSFDQLGLTPELLRAVSDQGYTVPTPIQSEAIPLVLAGRDVMAGAQTGTGKTAAFVLPMLQRLGRPKAPVGGGRRRIRALILAPTRELALQVDESVRTYGRHWGVRSVAIYGGVGFGPQVRALRNGPDVVVATPGRLLDHVGQRTIDLSSVEILVLDEADRMLDMGFIRDIRRVLEVVPAERQNLLFSATFSPDIRALAATFLHDPASIQATPQNSAAPLVTQVVHPVARNRKRELLVRLIGDGAIDQALVFTRTKHGANRLAEQLIRDGVGAVAIHGNKSQPQRVRALQDFKSGRTPILVATEIAARGLDISGLPHVVNFELPMVASDYVHRIGRTGRAGVPGHAVSLVSDDERPLMRDIERLLGTTIPVEVIDGFVPERPVRPEPIVRGGPVRPGGPRPQRGPRDGRPAHATGARPRPGDERRADDRHGSSRRRHRGTAKPGQPAPHGAPRRGPRPMGGGHGGHDIHGGYGTHASHGGARPTALPGERLARAGGPDRA